MKRFKGVIPALVSPLDENERINVPVLRRLIEDLLAKGVDGFYLCGATGEGLALSVEERTAILEEAKARLRKSRWMLTLILPFLVAFMLDALYLFVLSDLFAMIGIV